MKGIAIEEFGGRDKLLLLDLPVPVVGAQDVLIQVRAAGVNPVDWKIREGFLREMFPHEFPVTLGWDVAGIVTQVGAEVTHLNISDEVYAYCRTTVIHISCSLLAYRLLIPFSSPNYKGFDTPLMML